jgi:hypothetical protein
MAINIKPLSTIVAKYVARAGAAGQAYVDGINNPRSPWAASTVAAAATWASGVQMAVTDNRFTKGVNLAGDATWSSKAATLGAQRYPGGITAGQNKYSANIQPFLTALSNLTLPPRAPKGDPGNLQRVAVVDSTLRQLALSR